MNFFENAENFFREDFSEVVGIYYDGEKIFLARFTHKIEVDEINFELSLNDDVSPIEQLAEKIFMILNQRGWENSKIGFCLNDDDVIIFRTVFENLPQNEIDSAVEVWAKAQAGKNAFYSFAESDGEIWAETLSETLMNEYLAAFEKNSLSLWALTACPDSNKKNSDRAVFIAKVLKEKKSPNLLSEKVVNWNFKKFFPIAAGIFLFVIVCLSIKVFYDYKVTDDELESIRKILSEQSEVIVLQKEIDENILEMKKINSLLESQSEKFSKLNVLIRLGKIADNKIHLSKISVTENFVQVDGFADDSVAIEKYLRKLKNLVAENFKLDNTSTTDDGKINFTVKMSF